MKKNWLSYLLPILIAFQSVWAMADINQDSEFHELSSLDLRISDQHNQTNLSLDELATDGIADKNTSQTNEFDCHHCCHCCQIDTKTILSHAIPPLKSLLHSGYDNIALSGVISSLFRPPKA